MYRTILCILLSIYNTETYYKIWQASNQVRHNKDKYKLTQEEPMSTYCLVVQKWQMPTGNCIGTKLLTLETMSLEFTKTSNVIGFFLVFQKIIINK